MAAEETGGWQSALSLGGAGTSENLSYILRIGKALLLGFIKTLWQQHTASHPQMIPVEQPGGEDAASGEDVLDTAQVTSLQERMLRILQELNSNQEIARMAESVTGDNPLKTLAGVAEPMFATGINWGRIVVFFYFAYRVIAQHYYNTVFLSATLVQF
ncbi:apoptosis regulator BAX-like isoform X2 [Elgaria multicarinata webbii]|uniref:apoptosis regulator BAX-like isoform X2 n=1 Tax=Elgaria multicarinata webbii TaxID=159646 RepID=UPI002FCD0D55